MNRSSGFTLIEVMVAVAIVAVALPSLMLNVMTQVESTARLRDKTVAQWVASNRMAQVRLANATSGSLPRGKVTGSDELMGQTWHWRVESKAFPQKELKGAYGIQVTVAQDKSLEYPVASLFSVVLQGPSVKPATSSQGQGQAQ